MKRIVANGLPSADDRHVPKEVFQLGRSLLRRAAAERCPPELEQRVLQAALAEHEAARSAAPRAASPSTDAAPTDGSATSGPARNDAPRPRLGASLVARPRARLALGFGLAAACVLLGLGGSQLLTHREGGVLLPEPIPSAWRPGPVEAGQAPVRCARTVTLTGTAPLLDDLEDGDARVTMHEQRSGVWWVAGDGTGTAPADGVLSPTRLNPARGSSRFAIHALASGFKSWSGFGLTFGERVCYDVSVYSGFEFWGRGKGRIFVSVSTADTAGAEAGGACVSRCYDAHGTYVELTRKFTRYRLQFDELRQRQFGEQVGFDRRAALGINFTVNAADGDFDAWIDDVRFLPR